jgi:hypothetical protein
VTTKNGPKTAKQTRFAPGNPGGPGRPEGSRNAATLILDQLADGQAEGILKDVLDRAAGGDMRAAELILSRVWPPRKGRPVAFSPPSLTTADDIVAAIGAVLTATASGDLTPEEAMLVAGLLDTKRKAIETVEIEKRLTKLEGQKHETH